MKSNHKMQDTVSQQEYTMTILAGRETHYIKVFRSLCRRKLRVSTALSASLLWTSK